jgi:hypothetical protein
MSTQIPVNVPEALPTRWQAWQFLVKASGLQLRRSWRNRTKNPVQRYTPQQPELKGVVAAESKTPLWTEQAPTEQALQLGKVHNLRVALRQIHGVVIPAGGMFSFWAQVGRPSRQWGYVLGREIRQGCVIPTIAGGLCQLSNALYSAALDAGLEIIERHAHSRVIPGSLAEVGRDATVFWNYVDLRFRANQETQILVQLTRDDLYVKLVAQAPVSISVGDTPTKVTRPSQPEDRAPIGADHTCSTCGITACFRNPSASVTVQTGQTAFLVDEFWPEFDAYLQSQQQPDDCLYLPLDGQRWRKANYAWNQTGFAQVKTAPDLSLQRAWACRNFSPQGQAFQNLLLAYDQRLSQRFAQSLPARVTHLVAMQAYLPWLWQEGALGGRSFDVLMTRLPLQILQTRLDQVAHMYPHSPTLADFRVDASLVASETQALQSARQIITPHAEIAALFPGQAILLDWRKPAVQVKPTAGNSILFPASTLGRKGAYELREAARKLGLTELTVLGRNFEGESFWQGFNIVPASKNRLEGIGLVVLPAHVEHQPRLLLRAIAADIPVITTPACGLGEQAGVITVPTGDIAALTEAMAEFCQPAVVGCD